ncbi:hypothetical protein LXP94_05765, partial [Escherichia coli]|nr:hypothetical protein [Escherichia coli]MDC3658820.1 hypothetical protein [Escherichia coli]MDE8001756.1 hypothetical protein [Escherichia coli]
ADRNRSHWSTSKTPSYTKSVSWQHHHEDNKLIEQIDEYLDDTFMLFSSYGINMQDLQKWRKSGNRLFRCFVNATKENPASLSC